MQRIFAEFLCTFSLHAYPDAMSTEHQRLDTTTVKVLAHPLRSRLVARLRVHGPATATELAATLGTNSGATSYHLRRLADTGLVRDTGRGEGKRRVWEATTDGHSIRSSDLSGDEDAQTALDWLMRHYLHQSVQRYEAWLDSAEAWPLDWRDELGYNDSRARLTPDELEQLHAELEAVVARYRELGQRRESPARARDVHVTLLFAPMDAAYEGD